MLEVFLLLIEQADLNQRIDLLLDREGASKNGILEELCSLVDLIGLCEDGTKLVEHLRLLIEVR